MRPARTEASRRQADVAEGVGEIRLAETDRADDLHVCVRVEKAQRRELVEQRPIESTRLLSGGETVRPAGKEVRQVCAGTLERCATAAGLAGSQLVGAEERI